MEGKDLQYIQLNDIVKAKRVISKQTHHTPIISSKTLSKRINGNLYFKSEIFQKTGSFKPRGAVNKLYHLTQEEKDRGVIAFSAGNHAQGLAYAANQLGIEVKVVMPKSAPKSKINATREYGAEVILHGTSKDLMTKCLELQKKHNLTLVHPFDDPYIIAGQGTVGLEIMEDVTTPDIVVVPIGGGGLISGIATAIKSKIPSVKIVGVEPIGAPTMSQSLQKNRVIQLNQINTIADGLAAPFVGEYNLAHVKKYVDEIVLVNDNEIIAALNLILERCKLLTEPAGAAGYAALLFGKISVPKGGNIVCVLSGGNIDNNTLKKVLEEDILA